VTEESVFVGLVGCGQVAQQCHIPALRSSPGARVVAVCDEDQASAQRAAEQLRLDKWYADFGDMLKAERLDVVDICTPPSTHSPLAVQAAEARCHVLVEKPMALTVDECDRMVAAAAENRVSLGVVHNELFKPVVRAATSIVRNGGIGDLTGVAIQFSRKKDDDWIVDPHHWCHRLPGGIFGDILPHAIYLARELLGEVEVLDVEFLKLGRHDWIRADEVGAIIKGERGLGTIISSLNRAKETATMEVFGTKAILHLDIYNAVLTRYGRCGSSPSSRAIENVSQAMDQVACTLSTAMKKGLGRYHTGDYICVRRFIDSIRHGVSPAVTGEDGREVVRVLAEIAARIEKGR
jgi:predicted dehydrogenase